MPLPSKLVIPIPGSLRERFHSEIDTDLVQMAGAICLYNDGFLSLDEAVHFGDFGNAEALCDFWVSMQSNFHNKANEIQLRKTVDIQALRAKYP